MKRNNHFPLVVFPFIPVCPSRFQINQIFALLGPVSFFSLSSSVFSAAVGLHRDFSDSSVFGLAAGEPRPGPGGCPEHSGPFGRAPPLGHAGSRSTRHCVHSGQTEQRIESGLFSRPSGNARNVELRFLSGKKGILISPHSPPNSNFTTPSFIPLPHPLSYSSEGESVDTQ